MDQQKRHEPDYWPTPLSAGLLVELDLEEKDTNIQLLGGNVKSLSSGVVRAVSAELPESAVQKYLPDGEGSVGKRVLAHDHVCETIGTAVPDPEENGLSALVMLDIRRLVATVPEGAEDTNPPFQPLGKKVFLDFEYDETSAAPVGVESGEKYGPEESPDDEEGGSELLVPEAVEAQRKNVATVTKTGPEAEHVGPGMDVIPPIKNLDVIEYKGTDYYFAEESKITAVL
jgi:hypothetical protein